MHLKLQAQDILLLGLIDICLHRGKDLSHADRFRGRLAHNLIKIASTLLTDRLLFELQDIFVCDFFLRLGYDAIKNHSLKVRVVRSFIFIHVRVSVLVVLGDKL